MTTARGRVLKAGSCAPGAQPVRWEGGAVSGGEPAARVEVVREDGAVVAIQVNCRCGVVHELELVEPSAPDTKTGEKR